MKLDSTHKATEADDQIQNDPTVFLWALAHAHSHNTGDHSGQINEFFGLLLYLKKYIS